MISIALFKQTRNQNWFPPPMLFISEHTSENEQAVKYTHYKRDSEEHPHPEMGK